MVGGHKQNSILHTPGSGIAALNLTGLMLTLEDGLDAAQRGLIWCLVMIWLPTPHYYPPLIRTRGGRGVTQGFPISITRLDIGLFLCVY